MNANTEDGASVPDKAPRNPATLQLKVATKVVQVDNEQKSDNSNSDKNALVYEGEWLTTAQAAKALCTSKSTLIRRVETGDLAMRINEYGHRLFKVLTKGAAKEIISAKAKNDADALSAFIIRMHEKEEKSVDEICIELECTPHFIARTLAAYKQAFETSRDLRLAKREDDLHERSFELMTGSGNIPDSWAWVVDRFDRQYTFERARDELEDWERRGGDPLSVSTLVRRAIKNESAWISALIFWNKYEKANVDHYMQTQQALKGVDTRHALVEIWEKELKHTETGERIRAMTQREDDRHARAVAIQVAQVSQPTVRKRGRPVGWRKDGSHLRPQPAIPSPDDHE